METTTTSTTYPCLLAVATRGAAVMVMGTTVPAAALRDRSAVRSQKSTALLPISDVVVFTGDAPGIRSWSPPV